ncbi:hypothetical protein EPK99_06565 [Neorhizobium lilium]|uniref:Uncharacterized protein n=1 Tax=Neorhizobium lilium TaxID=2503024 RepID=A0A3S3RHS5_9HYPH|nr:hypothetical protein [Neorhizobium lilium]RWX78288.1 hypothetical protein EPK99_06565 [Neorhizobium lilium]
MNTTNKSIEERTSVETNINTIGWAILVQSLIRYGAFIAIAWLTLTFANGWVMAYLGASH